MSVYENLEYMMYEGVGEYEFPAMYAEHELPEITKWVEFDYSTRERGDLKKKGIHFFEHDRKFTRIWSSPMRYIELLKRYGCIIQPDFSMYRDFPKAVQIMNHYKNQWLGRYWQDEGMAVIPNIGWSTPDNYDWQFDGYPTHSIVAVSRVGCGKENRAKELFLQGYQEMLDRLQPEKVLLFANTKNIGSVELPGEFEHIKLNFLKE